MRTKRRRSSHGAFLIVTLVQCVLCAAMVGAAVFASDLLGLTELRPAFAALLTRETDALAVFGEAKELFRRAREQLPEGAFAGRLLFSVPMTQALEGTVTSGYGFRDDPISGERDFHTGVDIAAPAGSPVSAAYTGTVAQVGESAVYGNFVTLRHENFETRYCHCLCALVQEGDTVAAGDPIALVGATGRATGPHLHLELRYDGLAADPMQAMQGLRTA